MLKRFIENLDCAVMNGKRRRACEHAERRALRKRNPFCMEIMYRTNNGSELARLCNLFGSDKSDLKREELSIL